MSKSIDLNLLNQNLSRSDPSKSAANAVIDRLTNGYLKSAAVLVVFDPWTLTPFEIQNEISDAEREEGRRQLMEHSSLRYIDGNRAVWMLKTHERQKALAMLGTSESCLAALERSPDRAIDWRQRLFEQVLRGELDGIRDHPLRELRFVLQIIDWLSQSPMAKELPSANSLRGDIQLKELVEPFLDLVRDGFFGRAEPLSRLTQYVHGPKPDGSPLKPLLIYGPGGAGKSTLLAEFVLQQTVRKPQEEAIPFSYVDFDDVDINPYEPLTILIEAARQLMVQYPELTERIQLFIDDWNYNLEAYYQRGAQSIFVEQNVIDEPAGLGSPFQSANTRVHSTFNDIEWYIDEFKTLFGELPVKNRPWLLVLDTFEEVQQRSLDAVHDLGRMLSHLGQAIPQLRVIIGGRGNETTLRVDPYYLKTFDLDAAVAFLGVNGIANVEIGSLIFQKVGGNPLSLKLAARVVVQEGLAAGVENRASLVTLLNKIEADNIQGYLYRRVLEHIKNDHVRKLAHPGLTLRYVTPKLIEEVLAGPCDVAVNSRFDAERLFDELKKEVSLVTIIDEETVKHRADVRALMIDALHKDRPAVVHDIHVAAIQYYQQLEGATNRAEELYHRLFVDPDFSQIKERWPSAWHDQIRDALEPTLPELNERARTWLAGHLKLSGIEGVDWDEAGLESWEGYAEKRVRDLVKSNRFEEALEVLAERKERSIGSRLYFLETTLLRQQGRWAEAKRKAYDGIYSLKIANDQSGLLNLYRQAIPIDITLNDLGSARHAYQHARRLWEAQPTANRLIDLELDLVDLKLLRLETQAGDATFQELRQHMLEKFLALPDAELRTHPDLVRDILSEFANQNSQVLRRGINLLLLDELDKDQRAGLANVMWLWDTAVSKTLGQPPGLLLRTISKTISGDLKADWLGYMDRSRTRMILSDFDRLLAEFGEIQSSVGVETEYSQGKGGLDFEGAVGEGNTISDFSGSYLGDIASKGITHGTNRYDLTRLRRWIQQEFSLSELEGVIFDFDVSGELEAGLNLSDKISTLIQYFERRNRLDELIEYLKHERPRTDWDSLKTIS